MNAQLSLDMPPPVRAARDFEGDARADLTAALALAKGALDAPPWDRRKQGYWRIVFPQMAGWLPEAEREPMVAEFMVELERIEAMFGAPE